MTKILLIDDCEELRSAVRELLVGEGFDVRVAEGAEEGLTQCDSDTFDVVLCDLAMPLGGGEPFHTDTSAMVGVHAIYSLSQRFPELPIIAISGELTGAPLEAISRFGAVSSLSKPFGGQELLQTIDQALKQKRAP